MNALRKHVTKLFGGKALAVAALGAMLSFAGATPAQAADRDDCYRRVQHSEYKLDEAIHRHGDFSRQADHWRHELREARERCERERFRGR